MHCSSFEGKPGHWGAPFSSCDAKKIKRRGEGFGAGGREKIGGRQKLEA